MFLFDHRSSGRLGTLALALALANAGCACEGEGPEVSAYFDPPVVVAGRTTTVELLGTHTRFTGRDDLVTFDDPALEARQVRVDSAVHARIELFVAADAAEGVHDVIVRTADETLHTPLEVRRVLPEATLTLDPSTGAVGTTPRVTLTGVDTCFEAGPMTLRFFPEADGVRVESLVVDDPKPSEVDGDAQSAVAVVSIAEDAPAGERSAVLETACGPVSASFQVFTDFPRIRITPDEGFPGQEVVVTVTGTDTAFDETTTIDVGASVTVESVVVTSPTSLTATIIVGDRALRGPRVFQTVTGADCGELDEQCRQSATFDVLFEPGEPFVRLLPNHLVRGERAYVWAEGVRTSFATDLDAAIVDAPAGVVLHGIWRVGPRDALLDLEATAAVDEDQDQVAIEIASGVDVLSGSIAIVAPTDGTVGMDPAGASAGDEGVVFSITGVGTAFEADRTQVVAPAASGISIVDAEVVSGTELRVTADVSETAPAGSTELEIQGGRSPIRVRASIDSATLGVVPPALRAGLATAALVLDAGEPIALDESSSVVVRAPEARAAAPTAGEGNAVVSEVAVGAGARPGFTSIEIAAGELLRASAFAIVPRAMPACEPSRATVVAGQESTVGLATEDATLVVGQSTVDGDLVEGFTFIGDDLYANLAVPTDATPGPTGIVITTHGEIAACVLDVVPDPSPPVVTVEGADEVVLGGALGATLRGTNTTFTESGDDATIAVVPGGLGVELVGMRVVGTDELQLDVQVDAEGTLGAVPVTLVTGDVEVARFPIFVVDEAGGPALGIEPLLVRTGEPSTVHADVRGVALEGTLWVSIDAPGIAVSGYRVLSTTEIEIDLDASADAEEGLRRVTVTDGVATASALLYVRRGPARVASGPLRVPRGIGPTSASWEVPLASLSPGDTVGRIGSLGARVRVLDVAPSAPEQANVSIEALAPGPDQSVPLLLVTGDEVAVGTLDVRADGAAGLALEDGAAGDAVAGSPALFRLEGTAGETPWLDVLLDSGATRAEILSDDGTTIVAGPASGTRARIDAGSVPLVRISAADDAGGPFSLETRDLASGAARELEPNGSPLTAEALGDPGQSSLLELWTGGADVDVVRADPTVPSAIEILSGSVSDRWAAPRIVLRAVDAGGAPIGAEIVDLDPVVALDPGSARYFEISAVTGGAGPCLVSARPLVVVSEVAPGAAFVEVRSVPGAVLDGWSLELEGEGGDPLGAIDLSGIEVSASRLVVAGSSAGAGIDVVDGAVADLARAGGVVRVVYGGAPRDAVSWGTASAGEGTAVAAPPAGGSIVRAYGIDRDDNAVDFVRAVVPTPGG